MKLLTREQVAEQLGVHVNTVDNLRKQDPTFPVAIRVTDRAVRFSAKDIEGWLVGRRG